MSAVRHIKNNVAPQENGDTISASEMREFLQIVYRALMMVTRYLEKRYGF